MGMFMLSENGNILQIYLLASKILFGEYLFWNEMY